MIAGFADQGTEDIFNGVTSAAARRTCPQQLYSVAREKLQTLSAALELDELLVPRSNRLERLRGNRRHQHSIRINSQYRICFVWNGGQVAEVEITDYHR